ncbi:MAG: hypothetical protein ACYC4L_11445 [Chloroflexota bacterium]
MGLVTNFNGVPDSTLDCFLSKRTDITAYIYSVYGGNATPQQLRDGANNWWSNMGGQTSSGGMLLDDYLAKMGCPIPDVVPSPIPTPTTGFNPMAWVSENPLLAAGVGVVAFMVLFGGRRR